MKIIPINTTHYNKQPNFMRYGKEILDNNGKLLYRTATWPYRGDLDWKKFVSLLNRKYQDVDKVNIVDYACSIGTESFCLSAKLIKVLKEKANKFFPIFGKDIDKENIEIAKSNKLIDDIYGLIDLKYGLGEDFNDYFYTTRLAPKPPNKYSDDVSIVPKPFLQDKVIFEQADILEDIDYIPKSNTVIMCRNFWPYLKPEQREELAKKLATNFDKTCLFVIGDFDYKENGPKNIENVNDKDYPDVCDVEEIFRKYGLRNTRLENVWHNPKVSRN